ASRAGRSRPDRASTWRASTATRTIWAPPIDSATGAERRSRRSSSATSRSRGQSSESTAQRPRGAERGDDPEMVSEHVDRITPAVFGLGPGDDAAGVAIETALAGTLFVEAGAGTGKTAALVSRVVGLVRAGVPMRAIAAITFTEKAASELRARVRAEL